MVAMILGDGYLGQMSEPLTLPKAVQNIPSKADWALTGPRVELVARLHPSDLLQTTHFINTICT